MRVFMLEGQSKLTAVCAEHCDVGAEVEEYLPVSHHIVSIPQPQGKTELQFVDDTTQLVMSHNGLKHILVTSCF